MNQQRDRLTALYSAGDYNGINRWIKDTGKCFIAGPYNEHEWDGLAAKHDLCPAGMFYAASVVQAVLDAVRCAATGTRAYAYDGATLIAFIEPFAPKEIAA